MSDSVYLIKREQQELEAALRATDTRARKAHLDMAGAYTRRVNATQRLEASQNQTPGKTYRLDFFDGLSGHIDHTRVFEAESDEAAIAYADDHRGLSPMELWAGVRKVKRWEAFPPEI